MKSDSQGLNKSFVFPLKKKKKKKKKENSKMEGRLHVDQIQAKQWSNSQYSDLAWLHGYPK